MYYQVVLPARWARQHRRDVRAMHQMCKVCGRTQNELDFVASDRTWHAVVPARWHAKAVCLACFERFANDRGTHVVKVFLVNGP
jgi:hypothetical protein